MEINVAEKVIAKCGGAIKTAALCGCTVSWVHKWTYPKERNGRGGRIPDDAKDALLAAAARGEVDIKPEDFFQPPPPERNPKHE